MTAPCKDERWFVSPLMERGHSRRVLAGTHFANRLVAIFHDAEEAEAAVREHNDRLKENGPAEAATSPSRGPNNPRQENAVNEQHRTTAPSAAPAPRSYQAAFERLEGPISNLLLVSKTQTVLLDSIFPDCEARKVSGEENEAICHMASLVRSVAEELDDLWLDAHNESGAPVTATGAAEPTAAPGEHRVSLFSREGEEDNLTAITDAAHAARDLAYGLTAMNTEVPNKALVNAIWEGASVVHAAMNDLVARLEAELETRRSAQ